MHTVYDMLGAMKDKVTTYRPKLTEQTRDALMGLSEALGFYAHQQGMHFGNPSPGQLLDQLAAAYQADPTAVTDCLRRAGVLGDGPPSPTHLIAS